MTNKKGYAPGLEIAQRILGDLQEVCTTRTEGDAAWKQILALHENKDRRRVMRNVRRLDEADSPKQAVLLTAMLIDTAFPAEEGEDKKVTLPTPLRPIVEEEPIGQIAEPADAGPSPHAS